MKLDRAIASIHRVPEGWVRIAGVRRAPGGVVLSLGVYHGKAGRLEASWEIRCAGVRELSISDLDGGGIQLYLPSHPAARQYSDAKATLRCEAGEPVSAAIGALLEAHIRETDDWVPFDRYVATWKNPLVIQGPAFLIRSYSKALKKLHLNPAISVRRGKAGRHRPLRVLHLGDSHVVAAAFEVIQSASGLSNNRYLDSSSQVIS